MEQNICILQCFVHVLFVISRVRLIHSSCLLFFMYISSFCLFTCSMVVCKFAREQHTVGHCNYRTLNHFTNLLLCRSLSISLSLPLSLSGTFSGCRVYLIHFMHSNKCNLIARWEKQMNDKQYGIWYSVYNTIHTPNNIANVYILMYSVVQNTANCNIVCYAWFYRK